MQNRNALHNLLCQFVEEQKLTSEILASSEEYLFGNATTVLLKDYEVLDTVLYLEELMQINGFNSLSEVLLYFGSQKSRMTKFIAAAEENLKCSDILSICNNTGNQLTWPGQKILGKDSAEVKQEVYVCEPDVTGPTY